MRVKHFGGAASPGMVFGGHSDTGAISKLYSSLREKKLAFRITLYWYHELDTTMLDTARAEAVLLHRGQGVFINALSAEFLQCRDLVAQQGNLPRGSAFTIALLGRAV